jgi:citrate synthase
MSTAEIYSPGLEGVIAAETAISTLTGGLIYRGYPIAELVAIATFEEVAYLLLHGELPNAAQLGSFRQRVAEAMTQIPPPLTQLLGSIPKETVPMDALRTSVSVLAHFDADCRDNTPAAERRKAERLLGQIPVVIAQQYRLSQGQNLVAPRRDLSHAANCLYLLTGQQPQPAAARAFEVSLMLYAEHEFNASTFTARVVTSTESDLHSAVVAAIGALKGRLHGGANERVVEMLRQVGGPAHAATWLRDALARKERIMGFGHRICKTGDIRATILKDYVRRVAVAAGQTAWEDAADIIEEAMAREKNLRPNVDWPTGRLYHALGLPAPLYTPFFVAARIAGWCAHIIEQRRNNRLIRPNARYIGPDVHAVKPLSERN